MRLVARIAAAVACIGALGAGLVYGHYASVLERSVLEQGESTTVVIPEGAGWSTTLQVLRREGLVEYPTYFEVWARWSELPREVKAGTYRLEGPMALTSLGHRLRQGGLARDVEVTVREGLTIYHIADLVERRGVAGREAFLEAAQSDKLLEWAGLEAASFEGYLYPDTYRFSEDAEAADVVRRMHREWKRVWREVAGQRAESLASIREAYDFDRKDVVTLASIVEKESSVPEERPMVARVILNRLDESMKLQMDPTCVYGPDAYLAHPTPNRCKDPDNRYSTYVIEGLPPGPIANPSRSSLEAAVDPAQGEDVEEYLYFVARGEGQGGHVFSKTFQEHRRMVRKHLK